MPEHLSKVLPIGVVALVAAVTSAFIGAVAARLGIALPVTGVVLLGASLAGYMVIWLSCSVVLARWKGLSLSQALQRDAGTYLPVLLLLLDMHISARFLLLTSVVSVATLKIAVFRLGHQPFPRFFSWRVVLALSVLYLALSTNLLLIVDAVAPDLGVIASHPFASSDWKLRYKLVWMFGDGGETYYDFLLFIRDNTPVDAVILVPLWDYRSGWTGPIGGPLDNIVLYPRLLVHGALEQMTREPRLTHVVLVPGQAETISIPADVQDLITGVQCQKTDLCLVSLQR